MELLVLLVSGVTSVGLLIYSAHGGLVLFRFLRSQRGRTAKSSGGLTLPVRLPLVTTQIPLCNEGPAAERVIRAAADMVYPSSCHEIQVLDDSSGETRQLVDRAARELRHAGHRIVVLRRRDRNGGRPGALAFGLRHAAGELIAVLDSQLTPPPDFLVRIVPFFLEHDRLGSVEAAARHNDPPAAAGDEAVVSMAEPVALPSGEREMWTGIPGYACRCATIWRRDAIHDAGGWQADTVAEDLDLSYRTRVRGWQTRQLTNTGLRTEPAVTVTGCQFAQVLWAKGSIQVARKLLPRIWRARLAWRAKLAATVHLTEPAVFPFILTGVLFAMPAAAIANALPVPLRSALIALIVTALFAPHVGYVAIRRLFFRAWWRRIALFPTLACVGVGAAVANSRAVFEALIHRPSAGAPGLGPGKPARALWRRASPLLAWIEVTVGAYCAVAVGMYLSTGRLVLAPLLFVYAVGFLVTGVGGLHELYEERATRIRRILGAGRPRALTGPRLRGVRPGAAG